MEINTAKLSVITVNLNNVNSLELTLRSVLEQTFTDFELIIIDGGSTDGSKELIEQYATKAQLKAKLNWVSEKDSGIYNAMNKGIAMANGAYCYFLNSGEVLVDKHVFENIFLSNLTASIIVGNAVMVYDYVVRVEKEPELSFGYFYKGSICHQAAFIKRSLFDEYGPYDETLKIVSDWKFFLIAIVLNNEQVSYTDIDLVYHDLYGVSITQSALYATERRQVMEKYIPLRVLRDYDNHSFELEKLNRINKKKIAQLLFNFIDRCANKWDRTVQQASLRSKNKQFTERFQTLKTEKD